MKTKYSNFQKEEGQGLEATSILTSGPGPIVFQEAKRADTSSAAIHFSVSELPRASHFLRIFANFGLGWNPSSRHISNQRRNTWLSVYQEGSRACGLWVAGSAAAQHQGSGTQGLVKAALGPLCQPGPQTRAPGLNPCVLRLTWLWPSRPGKIESSFHQRYHMEP